MNKMQKTMSASERAEIEQWLATRKDEGLKIDPATAEVDWSYGYDMDPYGVWGELEEELRQVGRQRWARAPGSDIWVHFSDLPAAVEEKIWEKHRSLVAFPASLEGLPANAGDDNNPPF